jgi:hypothetical protein
MMISYLRVTREKRKILFCIRDVSQVNNEADLRSKIDQTYKQALNKARDALKLEEGEVYAALEYDIAIISVFNDGKFENEEIVMQRLRAKIEEMVSSNHAFVLNDIPDRWSQAWNAIEHYVKLQDSEMALNKEKAQIEERSVRSEKMDNRWDYLKKDLRSRFYDLMRDISLHQYKDSSIHELDAHYKSRIESSYQDHPHMKQAVLDKYNEEFLGQAIMLEKEIFRR